MIKFLLTCYMVFFSIFSYSQHIVWEGTQESINIGQNIFVLEDAEGKLAIEDVSADSIAQQFVLSQNQVLNFGFTNSFFWLRFSLENNTTESLLLELEQAFLPNVELYLKDKDGEWISFRAGYTVNLYEKIIKNHFQLFPLPEGNHEFYVRLQSYSLPIPATIWESSAYEEKSSVQKIIYGIYSGILIFVMFNNILLYFTFRKYNFLLYAVLVFLYAATSAGVIDGYMLYSFPDADMLFWYTIIPALNMPVALLYCISFLELKKYSLLAYKFSIGMVVYFCANILIQPFLTTIDEQLINTIQALILFLLITTLAIKAGNKGNRFGYNFALAYFIWFLFVLLEAIYIQTGFPPHFFDVSHISIAIFIEVFLLSYLLSKRFEWEKAEVEKAKAETQLQLLDQTRENERIVLEQNTILEDKVVARTTQLKETNEELTTILETVENERQKSESLLLNILPSTTARELKELGNAKPQNYEMASVLFTDFENFTLLTSDLSPEMLVKDLNECFSEFDRIVQQYGIEKIKTIGDAYMAAGGIPIPTSLHALDTVRAAIDIREYMHEWNAEREKMNRIRLNVRIGIHSGPLIAGVVGTHKFSYDIWGDTVNIASRIESNGQAGKVNISNSTHELVKDYFTCIPRGKIKAKGKGELEMHWVEDRL